MLTKETLRLKTLHLETFRCNTRHCPITTRMHEWDNRTHPKSTSAPRSFASTFTASTTFATQRTSTTKSVNSNNDMQRPCHTWQACFRISGKSRSNYLIAHQRPTMERRSASSFELGLGFEPHLSALIHLRTWCVPHGVPHRVRKANNGGRLCRNRKAW